MIERAVPQLLRDPEGRLAELDTAVAELRHGDSRAAELHRERLEVLGWLGRSAQAVDDGHEAVFELPSGDGRDVVIRELADHLVVLDRPAEAVELLTELLDRSFDTKNRTATLAMLALAHSANRDFGAAQAAGDEVIDAPPRLVDPLMLMLVNSVLGRLYSYRGDATSAFGYTQRGVELADSVGPRARRYAPWFFAGLCAVDLDDLDAAEAYFRRGLQHSGRHHPRYGRAVYHLGRALVSWHRAHYDECAGQANLALLVGNETSVYSGYRWAASLRALALFEVNGDEAGSAAMREAMTSAEREPVPMGSEFLVLARSRSVALTSAAQGFEALVEGWSEIVSAGLDYTLPTVAADLCRDGERFGREGLARQVVADLRQRHQDFGIEWIGALAQHCEGLANRDRHTVARSVVLFEATGREQARSAAFADLVELGGTQLDVDAVRERMRPR